VVFEDTQGKAADDLFGGVQAVGGVEADQLAGMVYGLHSGVESYLRLALGEQSQEKVVHAELHQLAALEPVEALSLGRQLEDVGALDAATQVKAPEDSVSDPGLFTVKLMVDEMLEGGGEGELSLCLLPLQVDDCVGPFHQLVDPLEFLLPDEAPSFVVVLVFWADWERGYAFCLYKIE
jgi:hypothetical protein